MLDGAVSVVRATDATSLVVVDGIVVVVVDRFAEVWLLGIVLIVLPSAGPAVDCSSVMGADDVAAEVVDVTPDACAVVVVANSCLVVVTSLVVAGGAVLVVVGQNTVGGAVLVVPRQLTPKVAASNSHCMHAILKEYEAAKNVPSDSALNAKARERNERSMPSSDRQRSTAAVKLCKSVTSFSFGFGSCC